MEMGEKPWNTSKKPKQIQKPKKKFRILLPSHPLVYKMEADCFPVGVERGEMEASVTDRGGSVLDCCDIEGEGWGGTICAGCWGFCFSGCDCGCFSVLGVDELFFLPLLLRITTVPWLMFPYPQVVLVYWFFFLF